ncbi:MAG: hypothetical protein KAS66_00875 [Candidatus Omnitrophica bacterium]|nr:hypothetical protein [Candidatus Omnitrophota bacterium]
MERSVKPKFCIGTQARCKALEEKSSMQNLAFSKFIKKDGVNPRLPQFSNKKIRTTIFNGGTHIFFAARKEFSSSLGKFFCTFLDCEKSGLEGI